MTARATELTNPASLVRVFVDALERLGYDAETLLAKAGLRRADLIDPDARVDCRAAGTMLGAAIETRPMKNLAVRMAAETPIGAFPLIDYLVLTSESVGEGLTQLARYLGLGGAPYALEFRSSENPVRVLFGGTANTFAVEFGVALTVLHLREETDHRLQVLSASFAHHPDDPAEIAGILGCPVQVDGLWSGFALPRESWEMPLRRRDPILRGVLEGHAREIAARLPAADPAVLDVRRVLTPLIAKGDARIESVARALATSPRSLQRRLAAAGVTYQQVLDDLRRQTAARYLSDSKLSIGEVAYLLGYSEPAAFHRAFKRWKGVTPQTFRQARGEQPLTSRTATT